jgi:hypothetical protein
MATAPAIPQIHRKLRPAARCSTGTAQPRQERTAGHRPHDFLRHTFRPFWAVTTRNFRQVEAEFFRSLVHLCNLYELPIPDVSKYPYPQNVALAYREIEAAVKGKDANAHCIICRDEQRSATLAVLKSYDTGRCLYYIPFRPLWNLVQNPGQQPLANVLLSVFAYLYQIAGIPCYADNGSYMDCQYDTLQNWIDEAENESEEDRDYAQQQQGVIDQLRHAGNNLIGLVRDKVWLENFEQHLSAYGLSAERDDPMEKLCRDFLDLYRQYPTSSIFDNIREDLLEPEETERIRAEQYISFYWSSRDCLYDMLFEMVNNDFQECGVTDEPLSIQFFDQPQSAFTGGLDFEQRLFDLIDKLCELTDRYDHD